MQGSFLGTTSVHKRLALAFSFLFILTLIVVAVLPSPSGATDQEPGSEVKQKQKGTPFVPGEALVRYKSEKAAARQTHATMLSADGRQLSIQIERFSASDVVSGLRLARVAAEDTLAAVAALRKQPDVLYAEPNYLWYRPTATPNDPCFPVNALPGCQNQDLWGLAKIGAPQAWDTIKGSRDTAQAGFGTPRIIVAVDDEGLDTGHQDLVGNIWTNPGEVGTPNGVDDDNNGFIDDINGYDFFNSDGSIEPANHATHVAGTIGATGNNGIGVVGVNWQVGLMSLKHLEGDNGSTSDAVRAAAYAKMMRDRWISTGGAQGANVRVINASWGPDRRNGNGFSLALRDVINAVGQSGILYVTSAGNDGANNDLDPAYPASYDLPNLISVAATDRPDTLASYSDFGASTITMAAPGTGILSTTNTTPYSIMSGTSMAAPHVSGAAALLLAANPNLNFQQLKALLIYNGDLLPSLAGKTQTGRRLNVGTSLMVLQENDLAPPGTVTNFHLNTQNGRSLNVGWTASGDDGAIGTASLYKLTFTDSDTGATIFLKSVIPLISGSIQAVDVKLPYRHLNGVLRLQEFDNSGNEGVPATVAVSVSPVLGDPYLVTEGTPVALSTGGTPLNTNCDDCFKTQALPFTFNYFNENFNSVKVGSNGAIYFVPPEPLSNDSQSSAVLFPQFKMIAGLWQDLRTDSPGKDVFVVTPDASRIIFRWEAVTFNDNLPVNFEIELRSNGTILTRYGAGQTAPINTQLDPVVGISGGEPETYTVNSHTSEDAETNLTNATEVTFLPRAIGITNSVQFSLPQFSAIESDPSATVTVTRSGDTSTQSSVDYVTTDGAATQKGDFIFGTGRLNFAAGETTKTFPILIIDDTFLEGTETFSVQLVNPVNTVIGARSVTAVQILDNDLTPPTTNPLDNADAGFFVRQHYLDFLNREPDTDGFAFWKSEITSCGSNTQCRELRRINVSAAFFLSIEFQETGYLVYRIYKAAYGNLAVPAGAPVPVRYEEFLPDSQRIALGVKVGIGDWQAQLENNKAAFAQDFVLRSRFTTAFPPTATTPDQFVDALFANAGVSPAAAERTSIIGEFAGAPTSANSAARGRALRRVAENTTLAAQEKNRAFVLAQYFGYLRRNPYDPPESTLDFGGYNFWLGKLNQFNGNFVNADMVKAFLDSGEYRGRFGP